MSEYLLDTDIASYIIKSHPAVRRRLVAVPMHEIAISAVTEGELRYGVARLPSGANRGTRSGKGSSCLGPAVPGAV